ncbi:tetratricopeptide repeat protein [Niveibacterium umoris]
MDGVTDLWRAVQERRFEVAEAGARDRLLADPGESDAWFMLAICLRARSAIPEAEACFRRAMALQPDRADIYVNLAHLLKSAGRTQEAIDHYREALSRAPAALPLRVALCEALIDARRCDEALSAAGAETTVDPAELWQMRGNAHFVAGRPQQAEAAYARALQVQPQHPAVLYNSALACERCGRRDLAIARLRQLVGLAPETLNAQIKLGDLLKEEGHHEEAEQAYRSALNLRATVPEVQNNLGALLSRTGRWREAVGCYLQARAQGLANPVLFLNLGNAYHALRQLDEALAAYREGLDRYPDDIALLTEAIHVQQKLCDWRGMDRLRERLLEPALRWQGAGSPPSPFVFTALPVDATPAEQQVIARRYADWIGAAVPAPLPPRGERRAGRLRIGYVSADYHNHATAHLMLGLFSRHDRARVEVIGFSYGHDDGSHYRRRIVEDCDAFHDLSALSDREAALAIRACDIDIVVDLKGYTGSARPAIFAWRPAPIQVQWLGYPGTLGAPWFDYIIADRVVIPDEALADYSEQVVWMPGSYQVNDSEQPMAASPTRAECGLPEGAFVFCCFNSPYKIDARIFAIWMDLLRQTPGSVLWLYAGNPTAIANLRREAEAQGVSGSRLVFAPPLPKAEHLARHVHADLFLDTLYYNAHTTGSDALWAGVPVITVPGATFAARVGASLAHALGMPELITPDLDSYRALALQFAHEPARLQAMRDRVQTLRSRCSLFDTASFARALDAAYGEMWLRHERGELPSLLDVAALAGLAA